MLFRYTAFTVEGEEEKGTLQADSREQAMSTLARRELTVSDLDESLDNSSGSGTLGRGGGLRLPPSGSPPRNQQLMAFAYEMAALLEAGLPLPKALELKLRDKRDLRFHQVVRELHQQVRAGVCFSTSLASRPDVFPPLFPALVRSGERSGGLPSALRQLGEFLERFESVKNRILAALTYPVTVVLLALLILSALFAFMVPKFQEIYTQMGVKVPWFTALILSVGGSLQKVLLSVPVLLLVGLPVLARWAGTRAGRAALDRWKLGVPVIGGLFRTLALIQFNKNLALLLKSGVERREAVDLAALACGNESLRVRIEAARKALTEGQPLHQALQQTGLFEDLMLGMVEAGESSGQLPAMLSKASEVAEGRLELQISTLLSMLEPLSMMLIGGIVGLAVLGLGAPLLSLPSLLGS